LADAKKLSMQLSRPRPKPRPRSGPSRIRPWLEKNLTWRSLEVKAWPRELHHWTLFLCYGTIPR